MAARLPPSRGGVGGREHDPRPERQPAPERERHPDEHDPDGQHEIVHRDGSPARISWSITRSVEPPSRWAKWRRGEVVDLGRLVVVAPDGVEHLRERPHDPARHERFERDVEVACRDVLLEVVGEEQHRPAEGRELEHDRRIVGDEQVDREQQVVDVDRRGGAVDQAVAERLRDAAAARARTGAS